VRIDHALLLADPGSGRRVGSDRRQRYFIGLVLTPVVMDVSIDPDYGDLDS